jgi:hypothetical protein
MYLQAPVLPLAHLVAPDSIIMHYSLFSMVIDLTQSIITVILILLVDQYSIKTPTTNKQTNKKTTKKKQRIIIRLS